MYEKFFKLKEAPFRVLPDPRFLWYSEQHLEAKAKILHYINSSSGPILLKADVGTGKTTLAKRIHHELQADESKKVVYIFAPKLTSSNAFLRFAMDEFGVKTERSYAESLKNFSEYLIEQKKAGITPVLLIDEGQNMNRDMLLLIQHLFNFSTDTEFLIQIAIFAQPDIASKLKRLESLKSRLSFAKLTGLDRDGTQKLMEFRWTVSGGEKLPFTSKALDEVYRITGGIPRAIVKLANEALLATAIKQRQAVDKDTVLASVSEISMTD